MQGITNVLWALARQDAKRAQLVQGKGQIFQDMAHALLQQSRHYMCSSLPLNLSTLAWSLGTINYHPGASLWLPLAVISLVISQYQHHSRLSV